MANPPLIIGHRGASARAPENTMAAFRLAIEQGADGVEFDVRLTRDGVPVVIHDGDLKRTGGCKDRVSDLSLAQLKKVDVGSWFKRASFPQERVPTLEEVFQLFESTNHVLYLEMKSNPNERAVLARTCCEFLRNSSLKSRVIVECFDLLGIESVKNIAEDVKTAALFEPKIRHLSVFRINGRIIKQALAVEADEIALHHRLATSRTIQAARNSNLKVVVWTVDKPKWIHKTLSNQVTALITNDPLVLARQRDVEAQALIRVE